jgi:DNA-binding CsgD family transcriptional regulator/PAS domain-containing protein
MVTVEGFSRLVAGIYAAAAAPDHWVSAIGDINRALGGTGGSLISGDRAVRSTIPREVFESYAKHYYRLDYVLAAVEAGPVGAVRTGPEVVLPNRNGEFYAGWMHPHQLEDGLFVRLTGDERPTCLLVTSAKQSFETAERVKLMNGLIPHCQQALRTQDKLAALANSTVELAGALDAIRHGVIIVAGGHRVINVNSAAERILRAEDGLCMRSGCIAATSTRAEQELHCAIQNVLAGEPSRVRTGQSFTCSRPSGKRPYILHVLPSHRWDADEPGRQQAMALILIIDPEGEPEPTAALLRRLYDLTTTEADVALRMIRGADLKQIAEELSVSLATVRTHLQHVFDKTDTHRQAELVRLLLVLSP